MSCKPTEPAMTITAKPDSTKPYCGGGSWIRGAVTPAGATKKVVVQRTVGGKWVDWSWYTAYDSRPPAVLFGTVDAQGKYNIPYAVPLSESTLHLRVRSEGGAVSPGFYVTPRSDSPDVSCRG